LSSRKVCPPMNPKRASSEFQPPEELHPDTEVRIGSSCNKNYVRSKTKPYCLYLYIYVYTYIYHYLLIYRKEYITISKYQACWCAFDVGNFNHIESNMQYVLLCAALCSSILPIILRLDQGHVTVAPGVEISPTGPSNSDSEGCGIHFLAAHRIVHMQ
jgi:hypothetical protein